MEFQNFIELLDNIQINLFVTDLETDEIIFMNKKMKSTYHFNHPEGEICWKLINNNQNQRCNECKKNQLKNLYEIIEWDEGNSKLKQKFKNYDCLIRWDDNRIVHLQQTIDVSDLKKLTHKNSFDELTGLLNRRAGMEKINQLLKEEKTFTVALADIDNLKYVNDVYGHDEGDFLLKKIAEILNQRLCKSDFIFRLSSDEFLLVYNNADKKYVSKLLIEGNEEAKSLKEKYQKKYDFSYTFGLYTVLKDNTLSVTDIIARSDEQMYKQKLRLRRTLLAEVEDNLFKSNNLDESQFKYDAMSLYDALIKSTDDFIYVCNMKTGLFRYSPAQVEVFNLPGEIIGNPLPIWKKIVHPQDWERFYKSNMEIGENKMDYHSVEFRAKNRDGEYLWLKCRGYLIRDEFDNPNLFAGIMTQLDRRNKIDPLTQLLNRQEFVNDFNCKVDDKAIDNLGLVVINIDDFKNINDIYDRSYGDYILKILAQIVQSCVSGNVSVYRLDSDQIGLLIENTDREEVKKIYEDIKKSLIHIQIEANDCCEVHISAGCALFPDDGMTYKEISQYADYALQYAKSSGKNKLIFFTTDILINKKRSLEILKYLYESISNEYQGFEVYYQPQVNAKTQRIIGVEALLRWQCKELGSVSPIEFIPILEDNGLIPQVGIWVLQKAIQACKRWLKMDPNFTVSVNVSALQMLNSNFTTAVKDILDREDISPSNIIIELTESYMVRNINYLRDIFNQLRASGIKIAMDDFGTGYASLEILKTVPADIVKIDRAFVKDIHKSKFDATFIRFIVEICHDVDIEVVLEGVETCEEYEIVTPMNLDYIQGYLFGKPVPETVITQLLKDSNNKI
ncbi:MAG: EAL domain-containing protein [Thomasclavelia sp.]|uniref:bifunctional diguanylate cyclase/phosphodiesterase n=1 Tax=Thomasclavelia sp. TaxID=3025757 RepID=UPI0039A13890